MTLTQSPTILDRQTGIGLYIGLAAVLTLFLVSGFVSYFNTSTLNANARSVTETHEVLSALDATLSSVKDAETGQRGFIITGDETYLAPYETALALIQNRMNDVRQKIQGSSDQQTRLNTLQANMDVKLRELAKTLEIRRTQGFESAQAHVGSDRGRVAMDAIRSIIGDMRDFERNRRVERLKEMEEAYGVAVFSGFVTCFAGLILSIIVAILLRRAILSRQRQEWVQAGQIGLTKVMVGDKRIEVLGDNVLRFLAEFLGARAGAFFVRDGLKFRRVATYGVPSSGGVLAGFDIDDGLLGQAAKDGRSFILQDIPDGYLKLGTSLGQSSPRSLLVSPVIADDIVNGVVELGFIDPVAETTSELFEAVTGSIGVAIRSANDRVQLQNLLEETQRQTEELQAQSEELRVSNEELEEQSRVLKESQTRLELQQAELEQTNVQLEQQTQLLSTQRDEAARARTELQVKARELEQASQYKSDFLANMSHELRTPLNSSLILAKLLADNREGNLSEEQIRYANTIQAAGNDLLALINDILDLSKIEAGHMEIQVSPLRLTQLMDDLSRTFQPVAQQRGLSFRTQILPGTPDSITSDRQRLEQVLKNILSNALKFTEQGEVSVTISRTPDARVSIAISDTGIGIPPHQQEIIFEAFRQADGTTNRKYGGTGLGLSISRELTRLLGGEIHLSSEAGRGSTFTIIVPEHHDESQVRPRTIPAQRPRQAPETPRSPLATEIHQSAPRALASEPSRPTRNDHRANARVPDDREHLSGDSRVILVVEDDEAFARILIDLSHELNFQCLVATTAEEGLAVAIQYLPSAVVLDVGLPDHSGLSVLDRLKQDSRTRHIPVHVVSAGDYAQTAYSLGAVGYMLKPVKRELLVEALQKLETRLAQRLRRVLVVEDDPVQLDSLRKLLGSHDVETQGAASAAECLQRLKDTTFDCMVLDLSLPDASGYSLLETLSREDTYAFPPVIVYTGRELSSDEEQQLRRYSKSIIIKGAKSPERLLDEVTLFLHQVVSEMPPEQQKMLEKARSRDAAIEGRRILIVEDDVRNVFALSSILEPRGAIIQIARNGREALSTLEDSRLPDRQPIDLVLMDVMMPEMDGITATIELRKRPEWKKLPVIMLTAKAMRDDQEKCLAAGANDYVAKPLDVEKLLSLIRVWMPR